MGRQLTNAASFTEDDADLAGLRRGLGQAGTPIPAYRTLGVEVRRAAAGTAVVRMPVSPHLAAPSGGLLPGAFAVLADACCGRAVATALSAGGAALTAQLRVEFIRPLPPGQVWIEGRAEADAVDDDGGLARGEIVDRADQLLGVASLRIIKASHRASGRPPPNPSPATPCPARPNLPRTRPTARPGPVPGAHSARPAPRLGQQAGGLRPVGLDVPAAARRGEQLRDGARGSARAAGP